MCSWTAFDSRSGTVEPSKRKKKKKNLENMNRLTKSHTPTTLSYLYPRPTKAAVSQYQSKLSLYQQPIAALMQPTMCRKRIDYIFLALFFFCFFKSIHFGKTATVVPICRCLRYIVSRYLVPEEPKPILPCKSYPETPFQACGGVEVKRQQMAHTIRKLANSMI